MPSPDSREAEMTLLVALNFADVPRTMSTLQAPADTIEELREALRVLAKAYRSSLPKQAGASREELLAVVDKIRGGTRDGWGYGRNECADFIARLAAKPADDPAEVWEAYCEEVPPKRRSPQGALAFGFEAGAKRGLTAVLGRGGSHETDPQQI